MRFSMRVGGVALVAVSAWLAIAGCQRPSAPDASGPSKQVTVAISGMNWPQGWPPKVREALGALPGVKQVQVDFERKQATLLANPQEFDESRTTTALEQIGFGGKVINK